MKNNRQPKKKTNVQAKKKVPTNKNLAIRVKKLEHTEELKYKDINNSVNWYGNTNTCVYLSSISQGDDYNQRVGEELTAKYLNFKLKMDKGASADFQNHRIILFWDKQANGRAPEPLASTSLSEGLLDDTVITDLMLSPHNYRTKQRYQILVDKVVKVNPLSTAVLDSRIFKRNLSLGGAKVKYSDSTGNISSASSRSLVAFITGGGNSSNTSYIFSSRFWFTG